MAEPGNFTPMVVYHSETPGNVPAAANLNVGELAINIADLKVYTKNSNQDIVEIVGTTVTPPPATALNDLTDVNITSLQEGDILIYDSDTSTWVNVEEDFPSTNNEHRFWRIGFNGGSGQFSDVVVYTRGKAFIAGQRWDKGNELDKTSVTLSNWTTASISGFTTFGPGISHSCTNPGYNGFEIDFGAGKAGHISGIDVNGRASGVGETVDNIQFQFSDDGVSWTVSSNVNDIRARTGADVTPSIDLPHMGNIGNDNTLGADTLFDTTVATIPEVSVSGGGGGGLTFVGHVGGTLNAVAGNYYLIQHSFGCDVTLPANPSEGDRVAVRNLSEFDPIAFFVGGTESIEEQTVGDVDVTLAASDSTTAVGWKHVELVYITVDNVDTWRVVNGELDVTPVAAS